MAVTLLQKWKVANVLVRHPDVRSAMVEVAVALLDFLNTKTLQCNPSIATVGQKTGLSRDTVILSIADLEALGVLKVDREVERGERAVPGQNLPSNSYTFDFAWTGEGRFLPPSSRKIRPPKEKKNTDIQTTPVGNSDNPQSEKPVLGSLKSRLKYGNSETGNNETEKRTRAAEADVTVNAATIIFDQGRKYLESNGVKERQARSLLGGWRRDHGDEALLAALREALSQGVSEPISFITASLRNRKLCHPAVGSRSASFGIEGA